MESDGSVPKHSQRPAAAGPLLQTFTDIITNPSDMAREIPVAVGGTSGIPNWHKMHFDGDKIGLEVVSVYRIMSQIDLSETLKVKLSEKGSQVRVTQPTEITIDYHQC